MLRKKSSKKSLESETKQGDQDAAFLPFIDAVIAKIPEIVRREEMFRGAGPFESEDDCLKCFFDCFSANLSNEDRQDVMLRFLKNQRYDVNRATKNMVAAAEFRRRQNLQRMVLFPSLIPLRGYNERNICDTLNIPFLDEWVSEKMLNSRVSLDEDGKVRLSYSSDEFYGHNYNDVLAAAAATAETGADTADNSSMQDPVDLPQVFLTGPLADTSGDDGSHAAKHAKPISTSNGGGNVSHPSFFARVRDSIMVLSTSRRSNAAASDGTPPLANKNNNGVEPTALSETEGEEDDDESSLAGDLSENSCIDDDGVLYMNTDAAGQAVYNARFVDSLNFHALLNPIVQAITKYIPLSFHYWDKEGHPVLYCKLGFLRSKKLLADMFHMAPVSTEPVSLALFFHAYMNEILIQLVRINNMKNTRHNMICEGLLIPTMYDSAGGSMMLAKKKAVRSAVVVFDCEGVKLHKFFYKPFFKVLKPLFTMDQKYYPELIHHVYVVNSSPAVSMAYFMIRGALHNDTRQKITFCSKHNSTTTLKNVIATDLIPSELGGRCSCPGGCIPVPIRGGSTSSGGTASESGQTYERSDNASESTMTMLSPSHWSMGQQIHRTVEKILIGARKSHQLAYPVDQLEEIIWEFTVKDEKSVCFSAVYIPATDEGGILSLFPKTKVQDGASHYICPGPGTIILRWSNSYLLRKTRVHVKVFRAGSIGLSD